MSEIYAKPIVDGKFWVVEQNGENVASLQKQEDNKFILSNISGEFTFEKKDELTKFFGKDFFITTDEILEKQRATNECYGYPTKTIPFNSLYDVHRKLPLYTKNSSSKSLHCAGWYLVKFKNWVVSFCPKLITVERYEHAGPFITKSEASKVKCNIK